MHFLRLQLFFARRWINEFSYKRGVSTDEQLKTRPNFHLLTLNTYISKSVNALSFIISQLMPYSTCHNLNKLSKTFAVTCECAECAQGDHLQQTGIQLLLFISDSRPRPGQPSLDQPHHSYKSENKMRHVYYSLKQSRISAFVPNFNPLMFKFFRSPPPPESIVIPIVDRLIPVIYSWNNLRYIAFKIILVSAIPFLIDY